NLSGNEIHCDLKFLDSFYDLRVLRISNNSFYGNAPNLSQNQNLQVCAVINAGEDICRDPSILIPVNCI
ncbi:hypothetical protein HDU92_000929, partial [Lobulomyces angularis]